MPNQCLFTYFTRNISIHLILLFIFYILFNSIKLKKIDCYGMHMYMWSNLVVLILQGLRKKFEIIKIN